MIIDHHWRFWFTGCSDDRKVGEKWERLVRLPEGEKEGICSLCECNADGTEFCKENLLLCFKPEGCIETEMKPDHCCPQCSKYRQNNRSTGSPGSWYETNVKAILSSLRQQGSSLRSVQVLSLGYHWWAPHTHKKNLLVNLKRYCGQNCGSP